MLPFLVISQTREASTDGFEIISPSAAVQRELERALPFAEKVLPALKTNRMRTHASHV